MFFVKRSFVRGSLLSMATLLFYIWVSIPVVHAADFSVNPPLFDMSLGPRDLLEQTITIENISTKQLRLYPVVNEVLMNAGGTIEKFQPPVDVDTTVSVTSWLEISRGRIEIAPGDTFTIPLTVRIHPDAKPGEYHAFVSFAEASNKPQAHEKALRGQTLGSVVSIRIGEGLTERLQLQKFTVPRFVFTHGTTSFSYTIQNTGGLESAPFGEVIFYSSNGNEVAAVPVHENRSVIAVGEAVTMPALVPELPLGKYKALFTLRYGNNDISQLNDTSFFYVIPLMLLIILFGAILLVTALTVWLLHRRMPVVDISDEPQSVAMYHSTEQSDSLDHDVDLRPEPKPKKKPVKKAAASSAAKHTMQQAKKTSRKNSRTTS